MSLNRKKKGRNDNRYYETVRMPREIKDRIQEQAFEAYYQECPASRPEESEDETPF